MPVCKSSRTQKMRGRGQSAVRRAARPVEVLESRVLMSGTLLPSDPGNDPTTALNLGTLSATPVVKSDWVGSSDTDDFFKFNLSSTAKVQLNLTALTDDADLELFDSQGNQLVISENVGTAAEAITKFLDAGTYYVDATALKTSGSFYTLTMAALTPLATEGGHTTASASNLGTLGGTTATVSGSISPTVLDDYYKFTLASAQTFKVTTSGLPVNTTNLSIEDGSGNVLASPANLSSLTTTAVLGAGVYYLHINSQAPVTAAFKLTLTLSGPPIPDGGGNSQETATQLGVLSSTKVVKDQVSTADPNDYWAFNVPVAQTVTVAVTGLTGDADIQLQTPTGFVSSSLNAGTTPENITTTLQPGLYYVDVLLPELGSANYTLTITPSIQGTPVPDNAGNTLATARNIGQLNGTQSFSDFVGPQDLNDYYKFTIGWSTDVNIALSGLTANADVQLLNSGGSAIASSTHTGTASDTITKTIGAGTYYARVFPVGTASTNYALSLTGTTHEGAGNTLATANQIGALAGARSFTDSVGPSDTLDIYHFTALMPGAYSFALSGLSSSGAATLALEDSGGGTLATGGAALSQQLTPGADYYVVVNAGSGFTPYTLKMAAPAPTNLGTITSTTVKTAGGTLTTSANANYYQFTLSSALTTTITLTGMTGDGKLNLFGSNGTILATSAHTGATNESISLSLKAGTYYIRVYRGTVNTTTNYTLTVK
jgi:trimeric autotransporter adhesin